MPQPQPLDLLPAELLHLILTHLLPTTPFTSSHRHPYPTLKNLTLCSRRLHAITSPYLFRSLRLHLTSSSAPTTFSSLPTFLTSNRYYPKHVAVILHPDWNSEVSCLELKKLLHQLAPLSLTIRAIPGKTGEPETIREKSARWPWNLTTIRYLRVETVDSVNILTMLLLQKCPLEELEVFDSSGGGGLEKSEKKGDRWLRLEDAESDWHLSAPASYLIGPGVASLKPTLFGKLWRVRYECKWPAPQRWKRFLLSFLVKLPAVREVAVRFCNRTVRVGRAGEGDDKKGEELLVVERWHAMGMRSSKWRGNWGSEEEALWRAYMDVLGMLEMLKGEVEGGRMESLEVVRAGEWGGLAKEDWGRVLVGGWEVMGGERVGEEVFRRPREEWEVVKEG